MQSRRISIVIETIYREKKLFVTRVEQNRGNRKFKFQTDSPTVTS